MKRERGSLGMGRQERGGRNREQKSRGHYMVTETRE